MSSRDKTNMATPLLPLGQESIMTGALGRVRLQEDDPSASATSSDSAARYSTHSPLPPPPAPSPLQVPSSSSSTHYPHHQSISTMRLPNPPTYIEYGNMRFLVMDAPSEGNLDLYLCEMKRHHVSDLVRVCDPTYSKQVVEGKGIAVHELLFPDGEGPSDSIVTRWLELIDNRFHPFDDPSNSPLQGEERPAIAVHCVAGLGRAPVLVAIALIEAGMSPLDAVTFLREKRRGAINNKQLKYLESYRRRGRGLSKCTIM